MATYIKLGPHSKSSYLMPVIIHGTCIERAWQIMYTSVLHHQGICILVGWKSINRFLVNITLHSLPVNWYLLFCLQKQWVLYSRVSSHGSKLLHSYSLYLHGTMTSLFTEKKCFEAYSDFLKYGRYRNPVLRAQCYRLMSCLSFNFKRFLLQRPLR